MKGEFKMKKILFTIAIVLTLGLTANAQGKNDGFFKDWDSDWTRSSEVRPFNRSFSYSFISFCICVILKYIVYLCGVSPNTIDNQMGMGFGWAQAFCECVFYLYFFHGCLLFFEKYNFVKGPKEFKVFVIVFASVFFLKEVFEYLSTASFIKVHRFANRFFLYGNWVLIFILYVFGLVAVIMISKYLNKQIEFKPKKEKKRHE